MFFGYNITISNAVGPYTYLKVFVTYNNFLNTLLWCAPLITAAISTLIAGGLALKFGRRRIMMVSDVIGIGGVIMTIFPHWPVVLIGRLLEGVTMGVTSVATSLYFTEITPIEYRGQLTNGPTVFGAIGILIATLLGLIIPDFVPTGSTDSAWRALLGLGMIPAILRLIGFIFIFRYETPYYYVNKRKYAKAARCLLDFYNGDIVERVREIVRERNYLQKSGQVKIWQLFSGKFRKALLASVIMFSLQYLSGFNLILAFTGRIYGVGVSSTGEYTWLPGLLGVSTAMVNLFAAFLSIWTTSRFGRRPLVIYGIFFTGVCLLIYGIIAQVHGESSLAAKIFLVLWPIPWNLSLGSVIVVITAETLPDIGVSLATCCGWIFGYLTFQFYPRERDAIGRGWTFIKYAIITMVGSFILWFIVKETRDKTKDQILKEYSGKYVPIAADEGNQNQPENFEDIPDDVFVIIDKDEARRRTRIMKNNGAIATDNNCDTCNPHRKYRNWFSRNRVSRKRRERELDVQMHQDAVEQREVLQPDVIEEIKAIEEKHGAKDDEIGPTVHVHDVDAIGRQDLEAFDSGSTPSPPLETKL